MRTEDPRHLPESAEKGYEVADAPVSPVFVGLAVLVGLMVTGFIGGSLFEDLFEATEVKTRPEADPLVQREVVEGHKLQAYPRLELDAYVASERRRLGSYGWVDRSAGTVHVPIERAMELVLRDGLPRWVGLDAKLPEPPPPAEGPGLDGASPSGGGDPAPAPDGSAPAPDAAPQPPPGATTE